MGNTSPHTVTELVEALEQNLGRAAVREYVPVPPTGDVLATFADIKHAREVRRGLKQWELLASPCKAPLALVPLVFSSFNYHVLGSPCRRLDTAPAFN